MNTEDRLGEMVSAIHDKHRDEGFFLGAAFTEVVEENNLSVEEMRLLLEKVKKHNFILDDGSLEEHAADIFEYAAIECELAMLEK